MAVPHLGLQIWKFSGWRYPHTPAQASCLLYSRFGRSQIVSWRDQQFGKNICRIFGHHHIFKEMSFSADYEISNKLLINRYLCFIALLSRLVLWCRIGCGEYQPRRSPEGNSGEVWVEMYRRGEKCRLFRYPVQDKRPTRDLIQWPWFMLLRIQN